jgi:hypothetical protein
MAPIRSTRSRAAVVTASLTWALDAFDAVADGGLGYGLPGPAGDTLNTPSVAHSKPLYLVMQ